MTDLMHRSLQEAAKATPTYIPDRIFSEAVFAVLKDDKGALRRLQIVLNEQLSELQALPQGHKHPETAEILHKKLEGLGVIVQGLSDELKDVGEAKKAADDFFKNLAASLSDQDPSYQPCVDLIDRHINALAPGSPLPASPQTVTVEGIRVALTTEANDPATIAEGSAKRELIRLLGGPTIVGRVLAIAKKSSGPPEYLTGLKTSLATSEAARKEAVVEIQKKVTAAKAIVKAAGPSLPEDSRVRDHVWKTLKTSLLRLQASVAILPAALSEPFGAKVAGYIGTLDDVGKHIEVKVLEHLNTLDDAQKQNEGGAFALKLVNEKADEIFAGLRGTAIGLGNQIDSSKLVDWIEAEVQRIATAKGDLMSIAKLRDAINALPESQVKTALAALADEVTDDLEKVKKNIESWFNDSMDRVSGWYKRNTQIIVAIIAVCMTTVLNADTLQFADKLWSDKALRDRLNASAANVQGATPPTIEALNESLKKPDEPAVKATVVRNDSDQVPGAPTVKSAPALVKEIESRMPLGWKPEEARRLGVSGEFLKSLQRFEWKNWHLYWERKNKYFSRMWSGVGRVLGILLLSAEGQRKLIGLAITAIAVSMGAPFWFDVLNTFVNVRSAGKKPKKSEDESTLGKVITAVLSPTKT